LKPKWLVSEKVYFKLQRLPKKWYLSGEVKYDLKVFFPLFFCVWVGFCKRKKEKEKKNHKTH